MPVRAGARQGGTWYRGGGLIRVLNATGKLIAAGVGSVTAPVARAGMTLALQVMPPGVPVAQYSLGIALQSKPAVPTHPKQGAGFRPIVRPLPRRKVPVHRLHA